MSRFRVNKESYESLIPHLDTIKHYYLKDWLAAREIARIYGTYHIKIISLLADAGVRIRTKGESQRLCSLRELPTECRDKEFVYDLYITQKMSRLEIADMFDVPKNKIASLLDYHQIPKRNRKDARVARIQKYGSKKVSEDLMDALEGLLLSDGTLTGMKHVTAYNLAQSRAHREYCEYFRDRFLSEGIHAHVTEKTYLIDGKAYPGVVLYSQGLTSLNNMLERFYPDREAITTTKGVYYRKNAKVIPDDLTLTPTHILHLYLGDGFASYTTLKRTQTRITLCTDGFSKSDQTELIRLIAEAMGVQRSNFKLHKHCGHYRIRINIEIAKSFFEFIGGKSPVRCYDYKLKLQ